MYLITYYLTLTNVIFIPPINKWTNQLKENGVHCIFSNIYEYDRLAYFSWILVDGGWVILQIHNISQVNCFSLSTLNTAVSAVWYLYDLNWLILPLNIPSQYMFVKVQYADLGKASPCVSSLSLCFFVPLIYGPLS